MKPRKVTALLISLSLLLLLFAGCGTKTGEAAAEVPAQSAAAAPSEAPAESKDPIDDTYYNLDILTASTTGSYYPVGCKMAEMFPRYDANLFATCQSTGGGAENIKLVSEADPNSMVGMANQINFALAAKAMQAFTEPISNLRLLFVMDGAEHVSTDGVQFAVPADSDIYTVYDFVGHNVSIGPAGSSCNNYVNLILESAGVSTDDFKTVTYLNYDEQQSAMSDGLIDVASYYSGTPTAGVDQLAATVDIRLIPVDEELAAKCAADWGFTSITLTPDTYSFLTEDVLCIQCAKHSVFVNEAMDDDLAYRITKICLDNCEAELWETDTYMYGVDLDNLSYGWSSIPVHPGAIRYYEEKGIEIPEGCYPEGYQK